MKCQDGKDGKNKIYYIKLLCNWDIYIKMHVKVASWSKNCQGVKQVWNKALYLNIMTLITPWPNAPTIW
jgi:hypothetical protein